MNEHSGNSGHLQGEQQAHIEELNELRRLVPSVNQRAALDAAIAALAARQPVGVEPVAKLHSDGYWTCEPGRDPFDRFGPNKNAAAISVCAAPPAPAAVPAPYNAGGIELTACQLHEALLMAGDPEFDTDFEDRPRVRIFRTESGHSGPGLYCECVDVEEEGCILLDGTSPAIRQQRAPAAVPVDAYYSLDADPAGIRSRVADCIVGTMMVGAQNHTPPPAGHWLEPFWNMARADATQPQPAAVPVDERQDAAIVEAAKLAYGLLWMGTNLTGPDLAHRARVALRDALGKQACGEGINAARATNPQPTAASVPDLFVQWLEREMPAGTIIGKPAWWAPKLARALRSAERGVLGGCNG
ncbi:hypothetical protein Xgly_03325 [Xanthomonas citri pv. glycines]|uniref:hypothetical protein n=1 Tax=Xanthomonas citri TaxID=346 RepID=UPI00053A45DA|nr:hypothetical protein [Xanthomonas citri]OOW99239.1 hypothetical protein Xgly_03325 [Xanthomonas citri pv. glycines]QTK36098.1 hypothetical protein XcgCFBP2526_07885 [Xanthomonas citri pv. glycines CFBP 2526]UIX76511.1 hypothetical protein LMJ37_02630 [Xanthomonas citri pv. glycines]